MKPRKVMVDFSVQGDGLEVKGIICNSPDLPAVGDAVIVENAETYEMRPGTVVTVDEKLRTYSVRIDLKEAKK